MVTSLNSTGRFRGYLLDLLGKIERNEIERSKAKLLLRAATEINRSIDGEAQALRAAIEAGQKPAELGSLKLADAA